MTKARIDWRKHDRNAPESTYVRLAKLWFRFANRDKIEQLVA